MTAKDPQPRDPQPDYEPRYYKLDSKHYPIVSGATKHYMDEINAAIEADSVHPMVGDEPLAHYLLLTVFQDKSLTPEDVSFLNMSTPGVRPYMSGETDEDMDYKDAAKFENLQNGGVLSAGDSRRRTLGTHASLTAGERKPFKAEKPTNRRRDRKVILPKEDWNITGKVRPSVSRDAGLQKLKDAGERVATLRELRAAIDRLESQPDSEESKVVMDKRWQPEDREALKRIDVTHNFFVHTDSERKAVLNMMNLKSALPPGLAHFQDLMYKQGIADNATKRERLEEEVELMVDVVDNTYVNIANTYTITRLLDQAKFRPDSLFGESFTRKAILNDSDMQAALKSVVWYQETSRLVRNKADNEVTDDISINALEGNELIDRLMKTLELLPISEIRQICIDIRAVEDERRKYMMARLGEGKGHGMVREVIVQELANFERIEAELNKTTA